MLLFIKALNLETFKKLKQQLNKEDEIASFLAMKKKKKKYSLAFKVQEHHT